MPSDTTKIMQLEDLSEENPEMLWVKSLVPMDWETSMEESELLTTSLMIMDSEQPFNLMNPESNPKTLQLHLSTNQVWLPL